jgi:hypothetical protein
VLPFSEHVNLQRSRCADKSSERSGMTRAIAAIAVGILVAAGGASVTESLLNPAPGSAAAYPYDGS